MIIRLMLRPLLSETNCRACLTRGCFSPYSIGMTNNPLVKLSVQQLKKAVAIREKIETLQKELDRAGGSQAAATRNSAPKKKGKLSAAARARISAMMKARWRKFRAQKAKK
ncbi:MAG: hypothetical protein DME19_12595 [Verrucomicrobia bacterium]|nr:MAG: hypothetical protein DME19_12595 [Verrucomicrobiota bacterium]